MKCRGFQLIEAMIVVAILAILAAIALPAIQHRNSTPEQQQEKIKAQVQRDQDYYISHIGYIKDKDTGLCFAVDTFHGTIISAVDCLTVRDKLP